MKKLILLTILTFSFASGCDSLRIPITSEVSITKDVRSSLKNASVEDKEYLYKVYKGLSLYLKNGAKDSKTVRDIKLLPSKVHRDYGWQLGKIKEFSDVTEEYLRNLGLNDSDVLDDNNRLILIHALEEISNGCN